MTVPYFLRNIIPRKEGRVGQEPLLTVLARLTWIQWAHFFIGWLAWTCDNLDFYSVPLTVNALGVEFNKSTTQITTTITLTLLFRAVGAVIFGILSDRFGRKWPLVINLIILSILQLGAGFTQTFKQFLALRALFGIGMGGIWGLGSSTALENLPVEVRGFASGVVQQGFAVGCILAACVNLTLVQDTAAEWRSLFWTASGISLFAAFITALVPESHVFVRARAAAKIKGTDSAGRTRIFLRETKTMLKKYWMLCIYAIFFATGVNFLAHGSQPPQAFIPLWILPSSFSGLAAGAFCIQFGVQGAFGVVPVYLAEISPPGFRATFPGTVYQLGNMASAAASQIEAKGGENLRTTVVKDGKVTNVPDYAKVQGILIGAVVVYLIIVVVFGPENHSLHFEKHKVAYEEGVSQEDGVVELQDHQNGKESSSSHPQSLEEKNEIVVRSA
ncbi:carboxylic acid transporter [Collybia nuda]|uniref:Carboxylic acid transporter n=1 Tax=Collybia nuda TaxID=64659 RepID=A0A9P5XXW3_9AGAR|nr:carboxylic acid transporter [Collybia nuda]